MTAITSKLSLSTTLSDLLTKSYMFMNILEILSMKGEFTNTSRDLVRFSRGAI